MTSEMMPDTEPMGKVMADLSHLSDSDTFSMEGRALFKDAAGLIGDLIGIYAGSVPVAKEVERILDEKSAWIASPNREVAQAIAIRAVVAAQQIAEQIKREWTEPEANTRPTPALSEIVAAANELAAREFVCGGIAGGWTTSAHADRDAARARFLSLVAAHGAEVAKVLEPFAAIPVVKAPDCSGNNMIDAPDLAITPADVRAAADLRRRMT